ncbi:Endochitinase A [Dendrobium catenatum]|uniref:chitinase n=1 Tax=Dendrobium catenatum TaxID=906689 RepID=A0A2I0WZ85_9ASPA|nr:Endochitinase A [Dendrobium catenatum]
MRVWEMWWRKNKYGYRATEDLSYDDGCQSESCYRLTSSGRVSVEDVVTKEFFDSIIDQAASSCEGKEFYTREAFLYAVYDYSSFGQEGTEDDSKREIAAFFAHVTHETNYFCYIEEQEKSLSYCDTSYLQYPCVSGKKYYGRGPLQISWNYNYGRAGDDIGFDGLNFPEIVSLEDIISFKTALWFWMNNVHSVVNQGFGATIRAINSIECDGGNTPAMNDRVEIYNDYCNQFGVSLGDNLTC